MRYNLPAQIIMNNKFMVPVSLWAFVLNLLVFFASITLLLIHRNSLPPTLPLWFSKPWGAERLAQPLALWLLPSIILISLVLNNLIAKFLLKNHKLLALILVWAALLISLILLFPLYRILLVVV